MISTAFLKKTPLLILVMASTVLLTNCKKPPEPSFTYAPTDNPEAGDTIRFSNTTLEAQSYEWDFGNGSVSSEENPYTIYESAGNMEVELTATNEAGSASVTESIMINDPTVLGFFVFSDTTKETEFPGCEIWVYDNEYDYNQLNVPQFFEITDSDGIAFFLNLEPQSYYIVAYKEESNGIWLAGGTTAALTQNQVQAYDIVCTFYPDENKKSLFIKEQFPVITPSRVIRRVQQE